MDTSIYLSVCPAGLMLQVEVYEKELIVNGVLKLPAQLLADHHRQVQTI